MGKNPKKSKTPAWSVALDAHVAATKGLTWAKIAAKLDRTEGGIRHWRNGTREIKLTEFRELCAAAGADPGAIMRGEPGAAVEALPSARIEMLVNLLQGLTPEQQRESFHKMRTQVEANLNIQRYVVRPLRTYSNEEVEAVVGKVPSPPKLPKDAQKPKREPGTALDDFLPDE